MTSREAANRRVTARIVQREDGTRHRRYTVAGRTYSSLDALRANEGVQVR